MNIVVLIMAIVGGTVGLLATGYLVVMMPIMFGWKVYRKMKYKISLFD